MTSIVLAVALTFTSVFGLRAQALADEGPPPAAESELVQTSGVHKHLAVRPGKLAGQVLYPDGRTRASGIAIRVWDVKATKFIVQTKADERGRYSLELKAGRYIIVLADRVRMTVLVHPEATLSGDDIDIIIPRGTSAFAQMTPREQAAQMQWLSGPEGPPEERRRRMLLPIWFYVAGGGLAATAVGVAVLDIVSHDGGGRKKPVSP